MELEGLKRALGKIEGEKIEYRALVTDRHGPVRKYMRLQKKDRQHYFDVFHVAKCEKNLKVCLTSILVNMRNLNNFFLQLLHFLM